MKKSKNGTAIYDSSSAADMAKLRKTRAFSGGTRISEGEVYTVVGFTDVAATATIPAWTGVVLETSKGIEIIAGVNQLLSQSLAKTESGFEMRPASSQCFKTPSDILDNEGKEIKCVALEPLDGWNFQKEEAITKNIPVWEMVSKVEKPRRNSAK